MTPDFDKAAISATETLIKYQIKTAPVEPLPILKSIPGVLVISFAQMSETVGMDRNNLVTLCGANSQAAVTSVHMVEGRLMYVVAYNQYLPFAMLQRALARELGMQVMIGCMTETSAGISAATALSPLVDYADLDGHVLLGNDPYEGIQIVDGKLTLVDKPGTGVTPL